MVVSYALDITDKRFERWAWRVALLMPIYQNFTSGHWKNGHAFSIVGSIVHCVVAAWGLCFFVFQVLASDTVRFILFVLGKEVRNMYHITGLSSPSIGDFMVFGYHEGLVLVLIMYSVILLGGFKHFSVSLKTKSCSKSKTTKNTLDEDQDSNSQFFNNDCVRKRRIIIGRY